MGLANCTSLTITPTLKLTLTVILTLTLLQLCCAIDQILWNSSNAAQLINWWVGQHVWSNVQLTKCNRVNIAVVTNSCRKGYHHECLWLFLLFKLFLSFISTFRFPFSSCCCVLHLGIEMDNTVAKFTSIKSVSEVHLTKASYQHAWFQQLHLPLMDCWCTHKQIIAQLPLLWVWP